MVYLPYQIFNHDKEKTQNLYPQYRGETEKTQVERIYRRGLYRIVIAKLPFVKNSIRIS